MERAIKTLAICIVISAVIISAAIIVTGRYKVYQTSSENGLAIRLDTITGDVKAVTIVPGINKIYIVPSEFK